MTQEQKAWLAANPTYEPVGASGLTQTGATAEAGHRKRGTILADGTFVPATKENPIHNRDGAFPVGVRAVPAMNKIATVPLRG